MHACKRRLKINVAAKTLTIIKMVLLGSCNGAVHVIITFPIMQQQREPRPNRSRALRRRGRCHRDDLRPIWYSRSRHRGMELGG